MALSEVDRARLSDLYLQLANRSVTRVEAEIVVRGVPGFDQDRRDLALAIASAAVVEIIDELGAEIDWTAVCARLAQV